MMMSGTKIWTKREQLGSWNTFQELLSVNFNLLLGLRILSISVPGPPVLPPAAAHGAWLDSRVRRDTIGKCGEF